MNQRSPDAPPPEPRTVLLGRPSVGERELNAVRAVFESGWLSGAGPQCSAFEQELATSSGTADAVATANCGAALHLAVQVLGAGPGDEVIVADYTFPAHCSRRRLGRRHARSSPTSCPDTGNIDPQSVADLVGPRTVGIIAVDTRRPAGRLRRSCSTIADRHRLLLLEDAACSVGATYQGRQAGSLADLAACPSTGARGSPAVRVAPWWVTIETLVEHARRLHTYGIEPAVARESSTRLAVPTFSQAGYNYRLSDVQAAIMRVQLQRLPEFLTARNAVAQGYADRLGELEGLVLPQVPDDRTSSWQAYLATVDETVDRDALVLRLRERGIGSNFGTYSCHVQPVYDSQQVCPVSEWLSRSQIALPMHSELTDDDLDWVAFCVEEAMADADLRRPVAHRSATGG